LTSTQLDSTERAPDLVRLSIELLARSRFQERADAVLEEAAEETPEVATRSGEHMKMDMRNALVRSTPVVDEEVHVGGEARRTNGFGDLRPALEQGCADGCGELGDLRMMSFGKDQRVARAPRMDVEETDEEVIFVDDAGRELFRDDLAEDARHQERILSKTAGIL